MDWLKQKYDRVILLVAALVTIVLSVMLILKANSFAENFTLQSVTPRSDLPETDEALVVAATETLAKESNWVAPNLPGDKKPALFLSVPIVEKGNDIINLSEEEPKLRPPVSNQWLSDNNLDFLRSDVLDLDPDKDGFSNLEEWNNAHEGGKSFDPKDPDSHPSLRDKLWLVRRESEDYSITFKSSMGTDFSVEWTPFGGKRQNAFVKEGKRFADDRFLVGKMTEDWKEENGIRKNRSILEVTDTVTGDTLKLVMGQELPLPTYYAVFKFDLGEAPEFRVKKGETFKLPAGDDVTYKLIDVQEDTAEIANVPAIGEGEAVQSTVRKKPAPAG